MKPTNLTVQPSPVLNALDSESTVNTNSDFYFIFFLAVSGSGGIQSCWFRHLIRRPSEVLPVEAAQAHGGRPGEDPLEEHITYQSRLL